MRLQGEYPRGSALQGLLAAAPLAAGLWVGIGLGVELLRWLA